MVCVAQAGWLKLVVFNKVLTLKGFNGKEFISIAIFKRR